MDFYKIGALKVFAELGALIEGDEIKFMDLPIDVIQNNIACYLLEDKLLMKYFIIKKTFSPRRARQPDARIPACGTKN